MAPAEETREFFEDRSFSGDHWQPVQFMDIYSDKIGISHGSEFFVFFFLGACDPREGSAIEIIEMRLLWS